MRETSELEQELRRHGRMHKAVEAMLSRSEQRHLLLVVDQFEELYTLCGDEKERSIFATHSSMQLPGILLPMNPR